MDWHSEVAFLLVNGALSPHVDGEVEGHTNKAKELAGKVNGILSQYGVGEPEEKVD